MSLYSTFKPLEFYSPEIRTKEEFFDHIERTLREGIKPAEGYIPEVYVVKNFPFSFGDLRIESGYILDGPGRVSLLKGGHWWDSMDEKTFKSIPEETLESLLDEFKLEYKFWSASKNRPHRFRQLPLEKPNVWYVVDGHREQNLFAYNFTVAYTNLFLNELSRSDFPEDSQKTYENRFLSGVEGR